MPTRYSPVSPPVALTIAGSDSGGGAGIQADVKTMTSHGVFGTSVLTATTAQNTRGVHDVHTIPIEHVRSQYDAVFDDFDVAGVKTGMLATAEIVTEVGARLRRYTGPIVVDPVMVAATGDRLLSADAEAAYGDLIAAATLVTPNVEEAEVLVDHPVDSPADAAAAGRELVDMGAGAALITGGHLDGNGDSILDTLVVDSERMASDPTLGAGTETPDEVPHSTLSDDGAVTLVRFESRRVDTVATHGSGCTLSSAIVSRLARGEPLVRGVERSVAGMSDAIERGYDVGKGPGAVNPTVFDGFNRKN